VLDRKYRTVINWSELGQQCTLDGSTHKNDVWCCWLFKLELIYPNLTWEHNLLKLCTSWNNTRAVCQTEEQEPVLNVVQELVATVLLAPGLMFFLNKT